MLLTEGDGRERSGTMQHRSQKRSCLGCLLACHSPPDAHETCAATPGRQMQHMHVARRNSNALCLCVCCTCNGVDGRQAAHCEGHHTAARPLGTSVAVSGVACRAARVRADGSGGCRHTLALKVAPWVTGAEVQPVPHLRDMSLEGCSLLPLKAAVRCTASLASKLLLRRTAAGTAHLR